jgi:hypothetical protein
LITPIAEVRSVISLGWNWAGTAAKTLSGRWLSDVLDRPAFPIQVADPAIDRADGKS